MSIPDEESGFDPLHSSTPTRATQQNKTKERPLRFLNVNFRSVVGKRAEILHLIDSVKPDVIIGTETWLDSSIGDREFMPDYYRVMRKDRNRDGGGVLIAIRDDIQASAVSTLDTNCEILWARLIQKSKRSIYICAYYRPSVADKDSLMEFETSLRRAAQIPNATVFVAGDLNFPGFDWTANPMTLKPGSAYPQLHQDFTEILDELNLEH